MYCKIDVKNIVFTRATDNTSNKKHVIRLRLSVRRGAASLPRISGSSALVSLTKQSPKCRERSTYCGFFHSYKRCQRTARTCRRRHAGNWASPATCCAALVTFLGSSASASSSPSVGSAASRRPRWTHASCTPGPSWRSVDESWGGSLKSKLLSGVTSQRCSRVFRSSTSEAQTLY